jgi:hypothetical protein
MNGINSIQFQDLARQRSQQDARAAQGYSRRHAAEEGTGRRRRGHRRHRGHPGELTG